MSVIITFMFEPAKLQMNWARASGSSARRNAGAIRPSRSAPDTCVTAMFRRRGSSSRVRSGARIILRVIVSLAVAQTRSSSTAPTIASRPT